MTYDISVLSQLINPLYKNSANLNLFIYSNFYDTFENKYYVPKYNEPIYTQSANNMTISEEDFNINMQNLFNTTVFDIVIDEVDY